MGMLIMASKKCRPRPHSLHSHVLLVPGAWQLPNAALLLHGWTAADADSLGIHEVADLQQVQSIQVVQIGLVCQVNRGILVCVDCPA
jgi:hypothetical protein